MAKIYTWTIIVHTPNNKTLTFLTDGWGTHNGYTHFYDDLKDQLRLFPTPWCEIICNNPTIGESYF